jgi:hypothetical protein
MSGKMPAPFSNKNIEKNENSRGILPRIVDNVLNENPH